MVGNYILESWVYGEHTGNNLRLINRETQRYYISDVQRVITKSDKYAFVPNFATKYVKDKSILGFRQSTGSKKEDVTYTIIKSPSQVKCKHSFEEIFENDLREIQHPKDDPLFMLKHSRKLNKNVPEEIYYKINLMEKGTQQSDPEIQLVRYLKKLFKVNKVFKINGFNVDEHNKQSIISKSSTLLQIITCNLNKKEISNDERKYNCAISFWLFDDRLVYQTERGKELW